MAFDVTPNMLFPRGAPSIPISPPVDASRMFVGSDYGMRSRNGRMLFHAGLDFNGETDAPREYPVFAIAAGVVKFVFCEVWPASIQNATTGYGNCVLVEHTDIQGPRGTPWCSFYAHLNDFNVQVGDRVRAGQQIARIGVTRNGEWPTMGYHLHFELRNLKASTYNNQAPDWMPGNNNTIFGISGDNFYRPGAELSANGTTCDPITWFKAVGIDILREPRRNAAGEITHRRGFIDINQGRVLRPTADARYAPRALPPSTGFAMQPATSSPAQIASVRSRLRRAAGVSGLGGGWDAALEAARSSLPAYAEPGAGSTTVVTPPISSGTPTASAAIVTGAIAARDAAGYRNLQVPDTDPATQRPASAWVHGLWAGTVALIGLGGGTILFSKKPRGGA